MKKLYWRLRIIWLSLKWCFRVNLGDWVWYGGKKYIVSNGVMSDSWRLSSLDNGRDGWVPRSDCKKVWTPKNIIGSFRSGYRFYMTSWFDIWVNKGIKTWMKKCNIW